jgi:hypothetical protein
METNYILRRQPVMFGHKLQVGPIFTPVDGGNLRNLRRGEFTGFGLIDQKLQAGSQLLRAYLAWLIANEQRPIGRHRLNEPRRRGLLYGEVQASDAAVQLRVNGVP